MRVGYVDERMEDWTNGGTEGRRDKRIEGWRYSRGMNKRTNEGTDRRRANKRTEGQKEGWIGEQMDGEMYKMTDEQTMEGQTSIDI